MKNTEDKIRSGIANVLRNAAAQIETVEDAAASAVDKVDEKANRMVDEIDLRAKGQEALGRVEDGFVRARDRAREFAKDKPFATIASAAAAGVALGAAFLTKRR